MLTMEERAFFIRLIREDASAAKPPAGQRPPGTIPRRPAPRETPRVPAQGIGPGKTQ